MGKHSRKDKKEKKERKEKKRRHRSSSPSSSSSDSDEEYKRRKAEKLAEKVAQHLKKHKVTGTGYTNEANPFGDTNLTERFVWGKKITKEITGGRDVREMTAKAEMKRQAERLEEIEKVKKRREQREAEKAAMAEELELIQRERAIAEAADLEKKEEEFHLEQARNRSQQRLLDGRPKPIDRLTQTIFLLEGGPQEEPTGLIADLTLRQLKDLVDAIANFKELDKHAALHRDYWEAAAAVAEAEMYEQQKQEDIDRAKLRGEPVPAKYTVREAGWHESIDTDVHVMLAGKTHKELVELEAGIQDQLDSGTAADPEYWQAVLKRLALHKAKARLREIYADMMHQHLAKMMADVDVPEAMGWDDDDEEEEEQEQINEGAEEQQLLQQQQQPLTAEEHAATTAAAAADDNEIALGDEEDEEGGEGGGAAVAAAAHEGGEPPLDAELEALACAPGPADAAAAAKAGEKNADVSAKAAERAAQARQKEAMRGEPRSWDDMSDGEQEGHALGSYSPVPLPPTTYAGQDVIPEEEDLRLLELLRTQIKYKEVQRYKQASAAVAAARPAQADADRIYRRIMQRPGDAARMLGGGAPMTRFLASPTQAALEEEPGESQFRSTAERMMGDLGTSGDAPFGGEVALDADSQVYWWHEKYRPRRPKYFNRVHTGYEWNKYNQTHYDGDNPPPKTVQGYKFNIFYPELLDRTVAPTYKIDKDPTAPDGSTCILRFTAGPPYEDVAFRIINTEWEYNHKRGFKCVFERGILHLYFNFHRDRYRR